MKFNFKFQLTFLGSCNRRTNDCKCDLTLFYSRISHAFVYLFDGNDYWRFSLMQILTQHSEHSMVLVINISPELNTDFNVCTLN